MKERLGNKLPKKSYFDLGYDCNTSANFGLCQPVLCREIIGQSSVNASIGSVVQLAPVKKSTFGRAELQTRFGFVQIADIWHAYEQFISGKPYSGSGTIYVPSQVPSMNLSWCKGICILLSGHTFYNGLKQSSTRYSGMQKVESITAADLTGFYSHVRQKYFPVITDALWNVFLNRFAPSSSTVSHPRYAVDFSYENADSLDVYAYGGKQWIVATNFSKFACNLRKVFIGCGYQLSNSDKEVSILPLVAFYKFWFDSLMPQRDITWKNTDVFRMMEFIEQNNVPRLATTSNAQQQNCIANFFLALCMCYYYQGTDFISAHITGTSLPSEYMGIQYATGNDASSIVNLDGNRSLVYDDENQLSSASMLLVRALQKYANKNTAIGGRIDKFLQTHFGDIYVQKEDSYKLGKSSINIEISTLLSQSDTLSADGETGDVLGAKGGNGFGSGSTDKVTFHAESRGYLVAFQTIIPRSRFCQGVDLNIFHLGKTDFYHEEFDALTLMPNPKLMVYAQDDINDPSQTNGNYSEGFGNIPVYSEYKVARPNILNGDMSRVSTRQSYLPYTMDKVLPYETVVKEGGEIDLVTPDPTNWTESVEWRSIGKHEWLGQFDRIFYNSGSPSAGGSVEENGVLNYYNVMDDNFIVHNIVDVTVNAPMIPISDSFDTDALEDHSITVEKV